MLTFDSDIYQGITLHNDFPKSEAQFAIEIDTVISFAKQNAKRIIWITLQREQSTLINTLTSRGFIFHSCEEQAITLVLKIKPDVYVPFSPTHTIGLGGVVLNEHQSKILIIKEHLTHWYKLPGGHMELDESIEEGVIRETYEETGILTSLSSIIAVASKTPYQLNKSNIYLACHLTPKNDNINVQDTEEIEFAKWLPIEEFFQSDLVSQFSKKIVQGVLNRTGVVSVDLGQPILPNEKRELFVL
ncbi:NUDIX domain-containing protein [Thorsellia kenyensis]|uniref:NUDIX domain-containing protein n=1 Tax=Thorsellia kenyensis TaxID=1549888 RepID=A0ABV6CCI7_9GAMM